MNLSPGWGTTITNPITVAKRLKEKREWNPSFFSLIPFTFHQTIHTPNAQLHVTLNDQKKSKRTHAIDKPFFDTRILDTYYERQVT